MLEEDILLGIINNLATQKSYALLESCTENIIKLPHNALNKADLELWSKGGF